jgi:hypothetical protein
VELAEVGSIRYYCVRTFYVWAVDRRAGRAVHSRRLRLQPLLLALSLRKREREREKYIVVSTEFWLLSISLVERENREQRAERHHSRERERQNDMYWGDSRGR